MDHETDVPGDHGCQESESSKGKTKRCRQVKEGGVRGGRGIENFREGQIGKYCYRRPEKGGERQWVECGCKGRYGKDLSSADP